VGAAGRSLYSRLLKVPSDPPALAYLLAAFPPSTAASGASRCGSVLDVVGW
jgi:hypothetical protein